SSIVFGRPPLGSSPRTAHPECDQANGGAGYPPVSLTLEGGIATLPVRGPSRIALRGAGEERRWIARSARRSQGGSDGRLNGDPRSSGPRPHGVGPAPRDQHDQSEPAPGAARRSRPGPPPWATLRGA